MPEPVANDQVWRVRVGCQAGDQASINVLHFITSGMSGTPTLQDCAEALSDGLRPLYKDLLSEHASFVGVSIQQISIAPLPTAAIHYAAAGTGLVEGDIMPKQVAGILSFYSNYAGPSGRGRMYIPFPGEASNDENSIPEGAYITALAALRSYLHPNINLSINGDSLTLQLIIKSSVEPFNKLVVRTEQWNRWATQRRRGHYGQKNIAPF